MTEPLNNTATSFPTTVTRAEDGELAGMDSGVLPLGDTLDDLSRRDQYLIDHLNAVMSHRPYVNCAGASPLTIGPIGRLWARDPTVASGSQVRAFGRTTEQPMAFAGLTAATWYYLYAFVTGGVLSFELVTDPPDPSTGHTTKTGFATHRYLCPVYALSPTSVRPFVYAGGRCTWLRGSGGLDFSDFAALPAGHATSYAAVAMGAWAPPHAVRWLLDAHFVPRTGSTDGVSLRSAGEAASAYSFIARAVAANSVTPFHVALPRFPGATAVEYLLSDASDALSLYSAGFEEPV